MLARALLQALRKEFSAYARSRGFSPPDATSQTTILDIQQLTKAEGVDLDQIPGVPHVITLPHKVGVHVARFRRRVYALLVDIPLL